MYEVTEYGQQPYQVMSDEQVLQNRERMTIYLIWKFRIAVYHESGIKNLF
jgi:hypothetical protein